VCVCVCWGEGETVYGVGGGAISARAAQGLLGQLARAGVREGECWVSRWRQHSDLP
jgi:hypothetical protein